MSANEYSALRAWQFARQLEAWAVALERFRLAMRTAAQVFAKGTWEERDATAEAVQAAAEAVAAAAPTTDRTMALGDVFARELADAKAAGERALYQRFGELRKLISELVADLYPSSSAGGGAASQSSGGAVIPVGA